MENPDWYAVRSCIEKALFGVLNSKKFHPLSADLRCKYIQAFSSGHSKGRDEARNWLVRWAKREGYIKEP